MKKILVMVMSLLTSGLVGAQQLSDQAYISVLTFGPGQEELYAGFGHSAIRVFDPVQNIDWAYNYGTFDYNQPNFYLNFARGHLLYKLAVQDFPRMRKYYEYFNRSITEQRLNATATQRQQVFDYLQNNARPENAEYYYDYFYNNCATKIGDVFVAALGDEFRFSENYVEEPGLTIRTLTDRLTVEEFPWGKLGIDICLGMPMDEQLTDLQYMFLPEYVQQAFAHAEIYKEGSWQAAVAQTDNLYAGGPAPSTGSSLTPDLVFGSWLVLVALLTYLSNKHNFSLRVLDVLLFLTLGLLGVLLLLLWVATDHAAAAGNLNLLWALPSHVIVAIGLLKRELPRWVNWYMFIVGLGSLGLVIVWPFLPQALNSALLPIVLTVAIRSFSIVFSR
jgi:hypothetical protein